MTELQLSDFAAEANQALVDVKEFALKEMAKLGVVLSKTRAERDRLKAINADLVKTLEVSATNLEDGITPSAVANVLRAAVFMATKGVTK